MSGQKANTASSIALQAAELAVAHGVGVPIALNAEGAPPEWIMLLPAGNGGVITTVDGRGPYRVGDPAKLASTSLEATDQLPIDENHATDLAAPNGGASPARGWVRELQARDDGVFGRVDWTSSGAALMRDKSYRFISPVFTHDKAGNILGLLRASLTNTPNLRGMAALHSETNMDLLAQLRKLLSLADDADEAAVVAKVKDLADDEAGEGDDVAKAAQTALASIAKTAGLSDGATTEAVVAAVTKLATGVPDTVKALQTELATVTTRLTALQTSSAKERATTFVDGEIARGRVGVKALRDHYIAMHAADPARVEKEIGALPVVSPGGVLTTTPPVDRKDGLAINMADPHAIAAAAQTYREEQAKIGVTLSIAEAVTVIKERAS